VRFPEKEANVVVILRESGGLKVIYGIGRVQDRVCLLDQGDEAIAKAAWQERAVEVRFPITRGIVAEVEAGIEESPRRAGVSRQLLCQTDAKKRTYHQVGFEV